MAEFPFQLLIDCDLPDNKRESLTCTTLLRIIPGRREVYEGLWNDRPVIVKLFSHKISARRHLKREWSRSNLLKELELSSPQPLFHGKTENDGWAVVTEKITDSSTVLEVYLHAAEPEKKLDLLVLVCRELAKQHEKGVLQKDLHLGNFLISDGKIFAIDPGQMRFLSRALTRKESISQLASLACFLPEGDIESVKRLCEQYACARNWTFGKPDELLLQKKLAIHRKEVVRKGLKKCLRTSKRCLKLRMYRYVAMFDKGFCQGAEPAGFIEQIDSLMNGGQILKNGNTCYVSRVKWNDKDVVIKRYNHKGFVHSLRHTIKNSRAQKGWLLGHHLAMLNIATPKPLAYIEERRGIILWTSYLAMEYIEGENLYNFLRTDTVTEKQRSEAIEQIKKLVDKLGRYKISHGDLKQSNILITNSGPALTDLDSMTVHKCRWLFKIRQGKDLKRLMRDGKVLR